MGFHHRDTEDTESDPLTLFRVRFERDADVTFKSDSETSRDSHSYNMEERYHQGEVLCALRVSVVNVYTGITER